MAETQGIKCVVVGSDSVGKTRLINAYAPAAVGEYAEDCASGRVLDFFSVSQSMADGSAVTVAVADTPGGESYDSFRPLLYEGADVFLLCFDVTTPSSFAHVQSRWGPELGRHCPAARIVLVGTKSDMRTSAHALERLAASGQSAVTVAAAEAAAVAIGAVGYLETCALPGGEAAASVRAAFDAAVQCVLAARAPRKGTPPKPPCTVC